MGLLSLFLDELKLANSCYMAAAIQFNYAIFYIFAGPLFANLEGYAFLDLLIWGVSPLLFELCREPLRSHIQPLVVQKSARYNRMIIKRRLGWFVLCSLAILISYLFMNYSSSFRWNYFSRIINIDFGYLLFDLACRCMEFVVEIEAEQQNRTLLNEQSNTIEPILHNGGYCKYRNIFMLAAYLLIFYLSSVFDTNDFTTGDSIFKSLSILCCIFTISIPILYIFKKRHHNYGALTQQEDSQYNMDGIEQYKVNYRMNFTFCLVCFSYFVNISYFSLWVMQGFKKQKDDEYQTFNKTLFVTSTFFLIGSFIQFVAANTYIGCKIKEGMLGDEVDLSRWIRLFLIGYGILILAMFLLSQKMEWQYMVAPIVFFGFHNIIMLYLTQKISLQHHRNKGQIGYLKLYFYCETTAYLIIPAVLTIIGSADSGTYIFGLLSGASLVVSGLYLQM